MPRLSLVEYEALLARRPALRPVAPAGGRPGSRRQVPKERAIHDAILAECRRRGLRVVHSRMDRATTVSLGTPDFIIALPGARTLWLEVKTLHGRLRLEQEAWLMILQTLGHEVHVIRSFEEFLSVLTPNP
jgi:hypothetical protein